MPTLTLIGIGRAGGALAIALKRGGVSVERLIYRNAPPSVSVGADSVLWNDVTGIQSDVLVIASADPDIRPISERTSKFDQLPKIALHLSGSLDSTELASLRTNGVSVGSVHPLVSISEPELGSERFAGAYFCVEGDDAAVHAAEEIVSALGGRSFSIPTEFKPLYHASAVMASGHVTALIDSAIEMLSKCGLERDRAKEVLMPLIKSTVANLESRSSAEALTGTFARGDAETFERHLRAMRETVSEYIQQIYLDLGERSVEILRNSSNVSPSLDKLAKSISIAKAQRQC